MRILRASGAVLLAVALLAGSAPPEPADAQTRRGSRPSVSARSSTGARGARLRVTRARPATSVRGVPTAPQGIRRLPVVGADGRIRVQEVFPRPAPIRNAPIGEVVLVDPFGDRRFFGDHRDPRGRDRFDRDRDRFHRDRDRFDHRRRDHFDNRRRDRFDDRGRDRFDDRHRFGFGDACGRGGRGGLRIAVGSDGVSVGVGTGRHRAGRNAGFRCAAGHGGGIILLPYGTVYSGGAGYAGGTTSDAYEPSGEGDGYYERNASGTEFEGRDGRAYGGVTGCAAVTVRMRGGEWYGAEVPLPALGADTPEALAAALRSRHRRGRSTVLEGFDGASFGISAGPAVEAVEVEPCR